MRALLWAMTPGNLGAASVADADPFAYVTLALLSVHAVDASQLNWMEKMSTRSITAPWYPARRFSDPILL